MENIFQSIILEDKSLVVGGDFNLTLSIDKVWGARKTEDPIVDFFMAKMEELNMVNIEPHMLSPTWSNERCGAVGITKILEIFLMARIIFPVMHT